MRLEGLPGFIAEYGAENAVGLKELVVAEWMSSEHSDCGNADQSDWDKIRDATKGCGRNALEVRKLEWRSRKVST